jgi:hypothetical protein
MPELASILIAKKKDAIKRWNDLTLETYAPETARLWRNEKDRFANPVGYRFQTGMTGIIDQLLADDGTMEGAKYEPFLDEIVRVRAVQDFTPSQAVSFVYLLKKVMRELLWQDVVEKNLFEELMILESRVDVLGLLALDIYCKCREALYQTRITQVKSQYDRLLKRANIICDFSSESQEG